MGEIKKIGVGVGVMVLNNKNQLLLGLRNPLKEKGVGEIQGQGTWTMPGGKLEWGETLKEAVVREVLEETSISVKDLELICVSDDITETAHYVTIGFKAVEWNGVACVMEPETIMEWKWFDLNNLPQNLYGPSKKILEKINKGIIY